MQVRKKDKFLSWEVVSMQVRKKNKISLRRNKE